MLQFNLRSLLLATLFAALATWVLFVLPGEIGAIVLLMSMGVFTSVLAAGVIYFREYRQAFCIGALVPQGLLVISVPFGQMFPLQYAFGGGEFQFKVGILLSLAMVIVSGLAAVLVRYVALRPPPPAAPKRATPVSSVPLAEENPFQTTKP